MAAAHRPADRLRVRVERPDAARQPAVRAGRKLLRQARPGRLQRRRPARRRRRRRPAHRRLARHHRGAEQHGRHLGLRGRDDRPGHGPSVDGDRQRLRLRPGMRRLSRRDGRAMPRPCSSWTPISTSSPGTGPRTSPSSRTAASAPRRCSSSPPGCPPLAAANAKNGRDVHLESREDLAAGPLWSARVGPGELDASFLAQPSYSPELGMFFISAARDYDEKVAIRTFDAVVGFKVGPALRASRAADVDGARRRPRPEVAAADRRRPRVRPGRLRPERLRARRDDRRGAVDGRTARRRAGADLLRRGRGARRRLGRQPPRVRARATDRRRQARALRHLARRRQQLRRPREAAGATRPATRRRGPSSRRTARPPLPSCASGA